MVRLATNGFFRFCRKCFGIKVERRFHRCTDIKCPLCLSKMRIPFGPFWHFFIGCMVSADHWLADYPELRRTTRPSTIGGPVVRRARILHFLQHWITLTCHGHRRVHYVIHMEHYGYTVTLSKSQRCGCWWLAPTVFSSRTLSGHHDHWG